MMIKKTGLSVSAGPVWPLIIIILYYIIIQFTDPLVPDNRRPVDPSAPGLCGRAFCR